MRSMIGTMNASVLPDPVGDLASTSRPARTSATTRLWIANGSVMPSASSAPQTARDTPRSAKDCLFMKTPVAASDRDDSGGDGKPEPLSGGTQASCLAYGIGAIRPDE